MEKSLINEFLDFFDTQLTSSHKWNKRLIYYIKSIENGAFKQDDMPKLIEDYFGKYEYKAHGSENSNKEKLEKLLPRIKKNIAEYAHTLPQEVPHTISTRFSSSHTPCFSQLTVGLPDYMMFLTKVSLFVKVYQILRNQHKQAKGLFWQNIFSRIISFRETLSSSFLLGLHFLVTTRILAGALMTPLVSLSFMFPGMTPCILLRMMLAAALISALTMVPFPE